MDIFWDLSIPDALDHLIDGRADAAGEWAGCAYNTALQIIIACNSSEPEEVGCFRNPIAYFSELDDELGRCGVPPELRPFQYLFAGPPAEIPDSVRQCGGRQRADSAVALRRHGLIVLNAE
ncbi:hypothetical protein GFY24_12210 [Nocardia sp. SYP-A9097]|uniref:DUF7691 family protein n=1 Tax=Nocardia sp. SYP-A9097 TaxID=2663237 RepID=UPI00129A79E5|nr:hypothetical protein [Nocardia sp. SYP-A9097]MRH88197.1 hypothetical protein [Nocardia sp. SYP-A9097]